jgi:hypothetical protein
MQRRRTGRFFVRQNGFEALLEADNDHDDDVDGLLLIHLTVPIITKII